MLQLECDLGGHLPDLVSKVGQIVVNLRGVRGKEGGQQQCAAGHQAPCDGAEHGLPRRLQVICHEMIGDLATHSVSDLQRIAEMNAAPDAHLFVLLVHLRKACELA